MSPKKCLNTSGEAYRSLGLKDKVGQMSDDALIEALAANGRLIKRPLISDQKKMSVGFKTDTLAQWTR